MAVETGFASSHTDLLTKIKTFVCDTMTPSGDRWISQRYVTTAGSEELIIKGIGSGTDQIFVGLKAYSNSAADNYSLFVNGYSGFNNSLGFFEQAGTIQQADIYPVLASTKSIPTNANAIKYWIIANSRRIIIITRVGAIYHQAYLGFYLPYGTTAQYPYPLCVGGSVVSTSAGVPIKGTETHNGVASFWKPLNGFNTALGISGNAGTLAIKDPGGSWRRPYMSTNNSTGLSACSGTWPYVEATRNHTGGFTNMRTNLNGTYSLNPVIIIEGVSPNTWGEFEGIRHVTGFNLSSEDTITVGSDTYIVFQDIFRTDDNSMVAYKYA